MTTNRMDLDWLDLTRRAALASHRLVGWIYWDPVAIERYAALGPDPFTYYVATRGASLGDAGNEAVTAAFYSKHAWPDGSAGGIAVGIASLLVPLALAPRTLRVNLIMPAVHLCAALGFATANDTVLAKLDHQAT